MNCFVIMPFAPEFDDVYAAIKSSVTAALSERGTCSRLDESRPAGRITERLLGELQSATLCLADVTGNRPNVMWELGYAMALRKPAIIVTQDLSELPFDIKDLQTLLYDRNHIGRTLGEPLKRMVIDTIVAHRSDVKPEQSSERDDLIGTLLSEVQSLKSMLGDAVGAWAPPRDAVQGKVSNAISVFEGSWYDRVTRSHFYARVHGSELVAPYCYGGNDKLTGALFDLRRAGEHWFGRFVWFLQPISGFAFLRQESLDVVTGAWWYNEHGTHPPSHPPQSSGVATRWERLKEGAIPMWAEHFHQQVKEEGLAHLLAQARANVPGEAIESSRAAAGGRVGVERRNKRSE